MAANAEDQARLLVSIEATQKKFERQLAAIAKAAGDSASGIEGRFKKANDNIAGSFASSANRSTAGIRQTQAAVSNLSFQLNDIAMGLASGTSPFTIMVQQGSQVAQVFQGTGGGLVGAAKTLGSAIATMVNPVSLASFAFIGLTGAAVQYLMALKSDVPDAEKLLKAHAEVIRSFDEVWNIAKKGADGYSDSVKKIALQKLQDEFGDLRTAVAAAGKELSSDILSVPVSEFGGATQSVQDFQKALRLLDQDIPDFRDFSLEMAKIEGMKGIPENIRELAKQLRLSANESLPLQEALEGTQKRLKDLYLTGDQAKTAFAAITASALGLGTQGGDAITSIADKIKTELVPTMGQALSQVGEYAKNLSNLQSQINKNPLGQLSPLYSGGGRFMNGEEASRYDSEQSNLDAVGKSAAAEMIRRFESFISNAKWDVNAFRVGFGSDTTQRANGVIEKVTKDTVVTLDDAQRDLSRRIVEFQDGIQKAIGIETWKSLSDAQQAALTSIAYNYGSLPDAIVKAIKEGNGPAKVAQAIAGLTANPDRRKQEAQAYLSGTGVSMSEAGLGRNTRKSPDQIFQGDVADIQKRIDVLNAEYAAQARLNPLINDYGFAVEKAKIQQQLLSEAQKAGVTVTPELAASIDALSTNYAKASSASENLKASQERLKQSATEFRDASRDVVGGFISDLRSGKSAAEALAGALDKVVDKLIDVGLNAVFGTGGGGGLLGGLFGGLFGFADGGVAAHGRPQPLKTFARGGVSRTAAIFGEAGPEAAVPLPDGRHIPVRLMEPRLPNSRRGGGNDVITINLQADKSVIADIADQRIQTASGTIVQVAVSQSNKQVMPTVARYQKNVAGGDYRG